MSLILIVLLLLGLAVPTFAQDSEAMVNCNGLSEADCQILIDSAAATSTISSFTIPTMQGELSLTIGDETMDGKISGSAAMILPGSLIAMMSDMQGMTSMTDMQPIIDLYSKFNSELLMQMLGEMGLHVTVDELVLSVPGETPVDMSLEAIFKDMGLYVRVPSPTANVQWFGETLEVDEEDLAEIDEMFAELITTFEDPEMQEMMAQMSEFEGFAAEFTEFVNSYVITTRGEDVDMMGQTMAVFTTTFDLKALLADPALPAMIMGLLENPALAAMDIDPEELEVNETQIQFVLMTAGMMLQEVTLSSTQMIGLDDKFVHHMALDMALDVDLSLMGGSEMNTLVGSAHFEADMTDINSTTMDAVEVPTEFRDLDDMENFLVGSPAMIEGNLALGETFSGLFEDDDTEDVFALALDAGQTVQIEIKSDDYPYVNIYGPDGFLVEELDTYYGDSVELTADAAGTYLIVVEAYWNLDYDLTVRVP
ncbi:MAG: hypothetical protein JXA10_08480 [Anaerolineae bacterium]|nr:hypothetical protein [Anaerolineae bacterium]